MSDLPKQQRYVYEKSFDLGHVLQNLQGYKLATGDILPSQLTHARKEFGDDEGKVYGSLITGAVVPSPSCVKHRPNVKRERGDRSRARAKRFKKHHKSSLTQSDCSPTTPHLDHLVSEHATISSVGEELPSGSRRPEVTGSPADNKRLSQKSDCNKESNTLRSDQKLSLPEVTAVCSSVGLSAIANYIESVESGESGGSVESGGSDNDAEGESDWRDSSHGREGGENGGGCSGGERGGTTTTHAREGKLEIPAVIQAMFEGSDEVGREQPDDGSSSEEEPGLGFFQPAESDDSETEGSRQELLFPRVERRWDSERNKWICAPSPLSAYQCWKCGNVGHLSEDCTVKNTEWQRKHKFPRISAQLQNYYAKCRELKRRKGDHCSDCGVHSNLACCLECGAVCCDGRGHLSSHLLSHPSHNMLYSYKLGRMLKCCKATCAVVNIYDLHMCSHCLGKAFSQHYSMINASWSPAGLRAIPNAVCCEDHFQWHRINCPNTSEEHCVTAASLRTEQAELISEFFF